MTQQRGIAKREETGLIKPETYTAVQNYRAVGGEVSLSAQMVRTLFAPNATQLEAYAFLRFCEAAKLNPFVRDAFLIKYDQSKPASIVIGKDAFLKRAEAHPQYDGFTAGIFVVRNGEEKALTGSMPREGDRLIGGWCKVYRKDRRVAGEVEVSMKEYDKGMSVWKSSPATMIRKVAIVQAMRETFPELWGSIQAVRDEYGLTVTQEEPEGGTVIDGQAVPLPDDMPPITEEPDPDEPQELMDEAVDEAAHARAEWLKQARKLKGYANMTEEAIARTAGYESVAAIPLERLSAAMTALEALAAK